MFLFPCRRRKTKRSKANVVVGDELSSAPQVVSSVTTEQDSVKVPDAPVASTAEVSAPPDAPKQKVKKAPWWKRWCKKKPKEPKTSVQEDEAEGEEGRVRDAPLTPDIASEGAEGLEQQVQNASSIPDTTTKESECGEAGAQVDTSTPDTSASVAPQTERPKKKKPWFRRLFSCLFSCCKEVGVKSCQKQKMENAEQEEEETSPSPESTQVDHVNTDPLPTDEPEPLLHAITPTGHGGSSQTGQWTSSSELKTSPVSTEDLSKEELVCLGFPNLAQTCYMNSTLQGLLTLTPFVMEVHNQQQVWRSHPESALFRGFVDVGVCRFTNNYWDKSGVLAAFKRTVADCNFEFEDDSQKDAHEFLCCLLGGLTSLSSDLHAAAIGMGCSYTCPVGAHMAFNMLSIRTCRGCGSQSLREEDFLNLSLDLACGGSVSQCFEEYLKETHLEFRCDCDAEESSQKWSFLALPNVLILQLQRFRFTPSFSLEKVDSPVTISRELLVNPESCVTEEISSRYSLVSIVSHLGSSAHSGHYICDGAHRGQKPDEDTDRWLTYNDEDVSVTTGKAVCLRRTRTAYLLFYEKQQ